MRTYEQRRINNSSKCSNCYGPHAFGGPAVLCVKFVLYDIQGYIQSKNLDIQEKLSERGPYVLHMTQKLYSLKASLHVICDKHIAYFRDY